MPVDRPNILICDDSPANQAALRTMLAGLDTCVITAASGGEALAAALEHELALVLLDVDMPDVDGYDVAVRLREQPATRSVPIIFLTAAFRDESHRIRAYGTGAVDSIEMPADEVVLVSKIRVFLDLERTRRELARTAERLNHILKSVADGIYGVDTQGRITFANAAMERLAGRGQTDLIGHNADTVLYRRNHTTKPLAAGTTARQAAASAPARMVRNDELWRPDGSSLPVDFTAASLMVGDRVGGAVVVVRDATERTRYEIGLEQARIAAEETSRAKSAFLAIMSHELRTPLNTILGFSEIIRDAAFGPHAAERYRDYAGDIAIAGTHLLELINDILDLSKIEAGRMEIEPDWQDLRHALAGVTRLVREKALHSGVELAIDLAADVPPLWADARAFKQIVLNLLSNALKFTPRGGRITIHGRRTADDGIRILVSDTGPGIAPDKLARLFKPFEQVDNRYNRSSTGTGLGLSLIKGLVEIHGGTVAIESTVGAGTTISFLLPAGPRQPARPTGS